MSKLHELLAAESGPTQALNEMRGDTSRKFSKAAVYFQGNEKSLKMLVDNDEKDSIESAARITKPVVTTVAHTLEYTMKLWANAQDVSYQKNVASCLAKGTIYWDGDPLVEDVPVYELLSLEKMLGFVKAMYQDIPTLDASREWELDSDAGRSHWKEVEPEVTVKTEKEVFPVRLAEATKEHPEQVQMQARDKVVGHFTNMRRSGEATAAQKAYAIQTVDKMIAECRKARMRANEQEVPSASISGKIVDVLLRPILDPGPESA